MLAIRGPSDGAISDSQGAYGYVFASARETVRRRQEACARLGIMPDAQLFGRCVEDLRAALSPDRLRMTN